MKPLRIILAGVLETAICLLEWWTEEMAERPHTRKYEAPDPGLYRKPPAPEVTCDHGLTLDRPCRECDVTRDL